MLVKLARALRDRGHSVFFVSPHGSAIEEACDRMGVSHFALTPAFRYFDARTAGILRRVFLRRSIQVAVVGASKDIGTIVLTKTICPSLRIAYFQQMQSAISKKDILHRWTYARLDRWITLTEAMKESTLRNTTVSRDIIDVVPVGVDLTLFRPNRRRMRSARTRFGLPPHKKIAGLIGRLDPQKGHNTFLLAASLIAKKTADCSFVIVGEETKDEEGYHNYLQNEVAKLKMTNRVRFISFTEDIPAIMAALDVVAMPSHSETYGYLAIEAMAAGIPVVGTKAGGLPEIILDQETGILVPPRNAELLAEAISRLFSDRKLHRTISKKGRQRALHVFDFDQSVTNFHASLIRAVS